MSPHSSYSSLRCEARAYVLPTTPSRKQTMRAGRTAGQDHGLTRSPTERFGYLVQESVSIHDRICYAILGYVEPPSDNVVYTCYATSLSMFTAGACPLTASLARSPVDQPYPFSLEHHPQDHLHRRASIYRLPDAQRLQAHPRSKPGHIPHRIPPRSCRRACHHIPLQIHSHRDALGLQHLAGKCRDFASALHAAAHRER